MHRYKLAVHILVILSVLNLVPVLAAPVPVQEVREACADVADGGEDVVVLEKRGQEGQGPWSLLQSWYHGSTSAQVSTSPQGPPGSPSASDLASGVHQESTMPSSTSGGIQKSPYVSGPDGVQPVQPGTSVRTKTDKWVPTTEVDPASPSGSSSSGQITPVSSSKDLPPPEQITPASSSKDLPPPDQSTPASSSKDLPPPEQSTPASSSKDLPPPEQITPASSSKDLPPPEQSTPTSSSEDLPTSKQITPASSSNVHQETTNSIQLPSSASGETRRPQYASGGTELPWYSSDNNELHWLSPSYGVAQQVQPGIITTKLQPASVRTKTYPFVATTEIETASESSLSGEITSPHKLLPPWEQEGYLAQTTTKPQPKSYLGKLASKTKSFLGNLASKSKSFLSQLTRISKSLIGELVDNPRLQIH